MDYKLLPPGNNVPEEVNAIIEIPKGEGRIKYEYRLNGIMIVDRLRGAELPLYPVHYCGIPATLAPDGDPIDLLILGDDALKTGDVMPVRPIGILWMTDEKGLDPKIISVPADSVSSDYLHIRTIADISETERQRIEKFFREYKKNGPKEWSTTGSWEDIDKAHKIINEGVDRWKKKQNSPEIKPKEPDAKGPSLRP